MYSIGMSIVAIILIAGGAEGYLFFVGRIGWLQRLVCGILGLAVFLPLKVANLIGCAGVIIFMAGTLLTRKFKSPKARF